MRKIIFRGKRIGNNEWVYGDLIQLSQSTDYWYIMPIGVSGEMYEDEPYPFRENDVMCRCALSKVNPSTVGQYTGLTDKNGKKIFEGDIVKDIAGGVYKVVYDTEYMRFAFEQDSIKWGLEGFDTIMDFEVIGNVFDNSELLKG